MKPILLWMIIFLLLSPVQFAQKQDTQLNILFVNSYDRDSQWTHSIEEGFIETIEKAGITPKYYFEYLSTKSFSEKSYFEEVKHLFITKYRTMKIDFVITTDDDATLFMYNNKADIFKQPPPLIFAGVNKEYHFSGETYGILENSEVAETIHLIQSIQGLETKILIITDATTTSHAILNLNQIDEVLKKYATVDLLQSSNIDSLINRLSNKNYEALIFLPFNRDDQRNSYTYTQGYELFKPYISVPVYSTWDFYLGAGILGGKMVSGHGQGQSAAQLAVDLLHGKEMKPDAKHIVNQYYFDDRVLLP